MSRIRPKAIYIKSTKEPFPIEQKEENIEDDEHMYDDTSSEDIEIEPAFVVVGNSTGGLKRKRRKLYAKLFFCFVILILVIILIILLGLGAYAPNAVIIGACQCVCNQPIDIQKNRITIETIGF